MYSLDLISQILLHSMLLFSFSLLLPTPGCPRSSGLQMVLVGRVWSKPDTPHLWWHVVRLGPLVTSPKIVSQSSGPEASDEEPMFLPLVQGERIPRVLFKSTVHGVAVTRESERIPCPLNPLKNSTITQSKRQQCTYISSPHGRITLMPATGGKGWCTDPVHFKYVVGSGTMN